MHLNLYEVWIDLHVLKMVLFVYFKDNDSKHKSKSTRQWMDENGVTPHVMITPASSPDINPIENVWSTMKDFLQRTVKPKTKDQLIDGIKTYWETVTPEKCGKFIDHIHKVLPVVVLNNGNSTDY